MVTCVRFLRNDLLASADDKGYIRFWKKLGKVYSPSLASILSLTPRQWNNTTTVHAHSQPISALSASGGLLATGSSDSAVKIWTIIDEQETGAQTRRFYPLEGPD